MLEAFNSFNVAIGVVLFISVDVMHLLAFTEPTPHFPFGHKAMFVGVATAIGKVMLYSNSNQNVSVRCDAAPTFPHPIF